MKKGFFSYDIPKDRNNWLTEERHEKMKFENLNFLQQVVLI